MRDSVRVAALLAAGLLLAPISPAQAQHRRAAGDRAVRDGNARFEVLSPTLIRTEYAPDGQFTDAATFNVVGREKFPVTPFRARTENGWLTIDTGALTLRYRSGSGEFTAGNLTVRLKSGGQTVTAAP